jgi:hypothetical protein
VDIEDLNADEVDLEKIDNETDELIRELANTQFLKKIGIAKNNVPDIIDFDFGEFDGKDFDFDENAEPFFELKINLGTNELPRFSSACHKSNIAVRRAISFDKHYALC